MILVRHALPEIEPDVPSRIWTLGAEGRAQAAGLRLPPGPVFASDEPKAIQTVELLGDVHVDPRFREVERPWIGDGYRAAAIAYLRHGAEGWEPREDVLARFTAAISEAPDDAIVGTHGLAMSLYVASVHGVDVVAFWSDLRFPDAWRLEPLGRI